MAESKEESLKPRFFRAICISLLSIMIWMFPDSTRAYIPYVQPSVVKKPSLPRTKETRLVVAKKVIGYGTGYFGPKRKDYASEDAYLKAVALNGEGKITRSGSKPRIGTIAADVKFYPFGTIIFIPEINLMATVEDVGPKVKGEKHVDIFCGHGKKAELVANTWGPGTKITLMIMKKIQI